MRKIISCIQNYDWSIKIPKKKEKNMSKGLMGKTVV